MVRLFDWCVFIELWRWVYELFLFFEGFWLDGICVVCLVEIFEDWFWFVVLSCVVVRWLWVSNCDLVWELVIICCMEYWGVLGVGWEIKDFSRFCEFGIVWWLFWELFVRMIWVFWFFSWDRDWDENFVFCVLVLVILWKFVGLKLEFFLSIIVICLLLLFIV